MQRAYNLLWLMLAPLVRVVLQRRLKRGKEDAARLAEKFGVAGLPRPAGKVVWAHASSAGESLSILGLVRRLLVADENLTVLVTTGTVTSARVLAQRLPELGFGARALHQFFPLDDARYVQRFHDHWQVDGVIWVESEIWPAHLAAIKVRGMPAVWVNARISAKSVRNWRLFGGWIKNLLGCFTFIAAQTKADAARAEQLSGQPAALLGNLKFATAMAAPDSAKQAEISTLIGARPVWLFASIHPGEEMIAARVHEKITAVLPDVLTILVPRHPQRGAAFAATLAAQGLSVAQRSLQQPVTASTDIYIADTMGELQQFYGVVKLVAMGGSFVPHGGQNPIEPARLGCAVMYGPHMFNFAAVTAAFAQSAAALAVRDAQDLAAQVLHLLQTPEDVAMFGKRALAVCAAEAASEEKIWAALQPWRTALGLAA